MDQSTVTSPKSATRSNAEVLSLPKGGGAIKGIGETFQPNLFTGTGNFTIPIATSRGRNGVAPQLALQYSTGNGNGCFGMGWLLQIPRITRKTEKGLPRYNEEDVFVYCAAEDLVPCLKKVAHQNTGEIMWVPQDPIIRGDYTVTRYRPRTEGLFARIEKWTKTSGEGIGDTHWRTTTKDNLTSIYGKREAARVIDPESKAYPAARQHVFEWLLEETFDAKGNHILYEYAREDPTPRLDQISEDSRTYCQLYIRRVLYGNSHQPLGPKRLGTDHKNQLSELERHYLLEIVFDYGELKQQNAPYVAPGGEQELTTEEWPIRPDPFSSYRSGFEIRTLRLCGRVLMFHHFSELGGPTLVKSTDFHYATNPDTLCSFLNSVTVRGYRREGGAYEAASMPPLVFRYSEFRPEEQRYQSVAARGDELPPFALDDPDVALVDLFGDGLPDVLHTTPAGFRYWKNLGNGLLDRPRFLRQVPAGITLSQPEVGFADMAGDGRADLLVLTEPSQGFYETTADETWETFRRIPSLPSFSLSDSNVRLIDLTGDGLTDVLMTVHHRFLWFECLGEAGYSAPRATERVHDQATFPDVYFDDPSGRVRLADMNGDGLNDIVLLHDGRVDYWPNLGYGHFGKRITMGESPRLEHSFDPDHLFLVDLNGTGCADLVYVDFDEVRFWFNRSGNGWSDVQVIRGTPKVTDSTALHFTDFFGTGTAALVWSYNFSFHSRGTYKLLDFCGGFKPYLLVEMDNNMGATTRVRYAASTKYHLEDEARREPWATKLPFPVHVVDKVEVIDHIAKTKLATTYKYHHGFFDGATREFRGFGRVDQFDTETLEAFGQPDLHQGDDLFSNDSETYQVPPVEIRTWFHTGINFNREAVRLKGASDSNELIQKYRKEYYREPGLTDAQASQLLLSDSVLPDGLTVEEESEAYRALQGSLLRQEVYARDGTHKENHPYTVTEKNHTVRCLQPKATNRHAVLFTHDRESVTYHYERNPVHARMSHALTLEVDGFSNVLKSAAVGYGRQQPDPALGLADQAKQSVVLIMYTDSDFTNHVDVANAFRTPLPCESRTYELTGLAVTATLRFTFAEMLSAGKASAPIPYEHLPTPGALQKRLNDHVRTTYRKDDLSALLPRGALESLALTGESYRLACTSGLVAKVYGGRTDEAMLGSEGRYVQSEGDTNWWIPSGQVFYSPDSSNSWSQELAHATAHFFQPCRYRDPFHTDQVDTETIVGYDSYDLLVEETRDALGNRVTVGERNADPTQPLLRFGQDYRVLLPALMMDPNRNCSAVAFDSLGRVVGTAVMGKPEDNPKLGDSLDGFDPDLSDAVVIADLEEPLADPYSVLQQATTRLIYDPFAYQRTRYGPNPKPATVHILGRDTHAAVLSPGQPTKVQHSFSYSDGFGREIQKKMQAEPGPVPKRFADSLRIITVNGQPDLTSNDVSPRWVGSGWTVFNNKGKPVRQYEPFFTDSHRFEFDVRIGVSPLLFYDPLGRLVATLYPNHTWDKVVFDPWRQASWDVNDTVTLDPRSDADVKGFFLRPDGTARVPEADYLPAWHALRTDPAYAVAADKRWPDSKIRAAEKDAAYKTALHAKTPTIAHFDSLGRSVLTLTHNGFRPDGTPIQYPTRVDVDIEGNEREVRDAMEQNGDRRGRLVMRYDYDMLGRVIYQAGMEAGERWMLNDVAGKPIRAWDSRGHAFRTAYDPLHRHVRSFVTGVHPTNPSKEFLTERLVYGEQHPQDEQRNLRGQLFLHLDQVGAVANEAHDFKGNLLQASWRLAQEYKRALDWSVVDDALPAAAATKLEPAVLETTLRPILEAETFGSRTSYDALNRPVQVIAPQSDQPGAKRNIIQPNYNKGNLLERVDVWLDHPTEPAGMLDPVLVPPSPVGVYNISYDAKGHRLRIDYLNGATTQYAYDSSTLRLIDLYTRRSALFTEDCGGDSSAPPFAAPDQPEQGTPCGLQNIHYIYDPAGNVTYIRDEAQQTIFFDGQVIPPDCDYTYDAIYRLIAAAAREHIGQVGQAETTSSDRLRVRLRHPGDRQAVRNYTEAYDYDAVGNLEKVMHQAANGSWTRRYSYDDASLTEPAKQGNRLSSTTLGNGQPETYRHDPHGNMLRMKHLPLMQWDHRDQLRATARQVVNSGSPETTWYVYDAAGQRARKVTERQATTGQTARRKAERIYLGGFEIYREYSSGGGAVTLARDTLHIMDDKQRVALVETRTDSSASERLIRYQVGNPLSSSVLELDDRAQIISYEEYYPYGSTSYQAARSQTETPKRYRYSGKERDEESGFYYNGARYYAPWLGRWTRCDPAGTKDGLNLFAYVRGNPISFSDPSGTGTMDQAIEQIESPTGWFFARTGYDLWNVVSLGVLSEVEAQENLGTAEGLGESAFTAARSISNAASLGLQDNIYESQMREGPGWRSILQGVVKTGEDVLPIEEADVLADPDASAADKWRAGGLALTKVANLFALGASATGKTVTLPRQKGMGTHPRSLSIKKIRSMNQKHALKGKLRKTTPSKNVKQRKIWEKKHGKLDKKFQPDHVVEKQLGGPPKDVTNLAPLDAPLNQSAGPTIQRQISTHRPGQRYDRVLIAGERVPVPDAAGVPLTHQAAHETADTARQRDEIMIDIPELEISVPLTFPKSAASK